MGHAHLIQPHGTHVRLHAGQGGWEHAHCPPCTSGWDACFARAFGHGFNGSDFDAGCRGTGTPTHAGARMSHVSPCCAACAPSCWCLPMFGLSLTAAGIARRFSRWLHPRRHHCAYRSRRRGRLSAACLWHAVFPARPDQARSRSGAGCALEQTPACRGAHTTLHSMLHST